MKKLRLLPVLLLSLTIGLSSCGDDKEELPKPAAEAAFTQNRNIVEVNELVTFTNSSTNASRYEWDFGNGQSSTIASPTAVYSTVGSYTVKMTAYNEENKPVVTTSTIKVGKRYLTAVRITN